MRKDLDMRKMARLVFGSMGLGALLFAARRVAYAPPDPKVAVRSEAASYSGPWTHGYKVVNGIKLHYAEIGNAGAPLVVLLHGFPECWYEWRNIMPPLAERFHVVAPDMRGYNWSERPRGISNYTADKLAADVAALIGGLGYERAHVVGHDWGGAVAWHFGASHPERLDKLVVMNAPHPSAMQRELMRGKQLLRSYYILFFQLPLLPEAAVRILLRSSLRGSAFVPGAFSDEALDVYQNAISQPGAATAMLNYYRAAVRTSFRSGRMDATVRRPTLVIWGMKDFALVPELLDGLDRWVLDLRVQEVEDCGHWVPEEKPSLVTESLLEFLP
jgi:pimeloyl-ACP methyl ester carboxylesterase